MLKIGNEIETSLTSPWLIGQLAPKLQLFGSGKLNVIGTPKMTPKTLPNEILTTHDLISKNYT